MADDAARYKEERTYIHELFLQLFTQCDADRACGARSEARRRGCTKMCVCDERRYSSVVPVCLGCCPEVYTVPRLSLCENSTPRAPVATRRGKQMHRYSYKTVPRLSFFPVSHMASFSSKDFKLAVFKRFEHSKKAARLHHKPLQD